MKKKIFATLAIAALFSLAVATPAFAATGTTNEELTESAAERAAEAATQSRVTIQGTLSGMSANSFSLMLSNGQTYTVFPMSGVVVWDVNRQPSSFSNFRIGDTVRAFGTINRNALTLNASIVRDISISNGVSLNQNTNGMITGTVTSVSGNQVTIQLPNGQLVTLDLSNSIVTSNGVIINPSQLTVGSQVAVSSNFSGPSTVGNSFVVTTTGGSTSVSTVGVSV